VVVQMRIPIWIMPARRIHRSRSALGHDGREPARLATGSASTYSDFARPTNLGLARGLKVVKTGSVAVLRPCTTITAWKVATLIRVGTLEQSRKNPGFARDFRA